ncbi:MAG: VOC family protein [Desulfomonilaceae bacterium]
MKLEKIDHICIAVKDRGLAEARFKEVFGFEPDERYIDNDEKIDVARYYIGDVGFELVAPTSDDSEVARFIRRRGEGLYLLSLKVPDTNETLEELKKKPVELIDETPRTWRDSRFAFIHPHSMFGVLLEIID